jgi:membrane associated rhomboid family serine protease
MKFPAIGTLPLLGILFFVFLVQGAVPGFTERFDFVPSLMFSEPWRMVTSIFLHANLLHILFNAFALFMFGPLVEKRLGDAEVLKIFLSAGLVGSIFYWLAYMAGITPDVAALGASGAIYGIMAAAAVLFPEAVVFMWFFPMKMKQAVVVWTLVEFIGTFDMVGSGIASAAHLGGLFFGYLYTRVRMKKLTEDYYQAYSI